MRVSTSLCPRWRVARQDRDSIAEAIGALNELLRNKAFDLRMVTRIGERERELSHKTDCCLDGDIRLGYSKGKDIILPMRHNTVSIAAKEIEGRRTEITLLSPGGAHIFIPVRQGLMKFYIHRVRNPAP